MTTETATSLRRCIGSTRFGIEAHEAPVYEFPVQPSQKDGLGRICKPHWRAYTKALRKAAVARKAAEATVVIEAPEPTPEVVAEPEATEPRKPRRAKATDEPGPEVTEATVG